MDERNRGQMFKPLLRLLQLVIDDLRTTAFDVCEAAIKDIFEIEYMVIIPDKLFFKMEAKGKPRIICFIVRLCSTAIFVLELSNWFIYML